MGKSWQLELFSSQQPGRIQEETRGGLFFGYLFSHEKAILTVIGFIITGVVSFFLGVQKGRSISQFKINNMDRIQQMQIPAHQTQIPTHPVENQKSPEREIIKPSDKKDSLQHSYTIQLASYQNKTGALKEAERLRREGFSPVVLSKGKYTVLCVGNFSSHSKAQLVLSELKKRYRDCFIRRM